MAHTPVDFLLSSALIGAVMPRVLDRIAPLLLGLLHRAGIPAAHAPVHSTLAPALIFVLLWAINQLIRLLRLRNSQVFERRASYNLLRSSRQQRVLVLSFMAAASTPALLATHLPVLAFLAAVIAVVCSRYLFFVSVVPLSMGLTYVQARAA